MKIKQGGGICFFSTEKIRYEWKTSDEKRSSESGENESLLRLHPSFAQEILGNLNGIGGCAFTKIIRNNPEV